MFVVFGPALLTVIESILVMLFVPHPVPKTATGGHRLYLAHCATCHGADGRGSWRATIFLMRPRTYPTRASWTGSRTTTSSR